MKPKEPLLAVIWSLITPGLGQVYSGRFWRGIIFFCVPWITIGPGILYLINPNTKVSLSFFVCYILLWLILALYIAVDAYRCSRVYNSARNLQRKITLERKIGLIIGIVFLSFIFNPMQMVGRAISAYIKQNYIQAFKMPADSMSPTLLAGDRIFVDKAIYKRAKPQRGDLLVFVYPQDRKREFVKRVVGLPNETVEIKDGTILINGMALTQPEVFNSLHYYNQGDFGKEGQQLKIPEDSYFVLGDHSASSHDSRYWGFVSRADIIGKIYKIYYPFNRSGSVK